MIWAFETTVWCRCRRSPVVRNVLNTRTRRYGFTSATVCAGVHARPTAETPKPALSRNSLYRYELFFFGCVRTR